MADGYYARRSKEIRDVAIAKFFQPRHVTVLKRSLGVKSHVDAMRVLRQTPYKFGVLKIMEDHGGRRSATYHTDRDTALGFELLKFLHDGLPSIKPEERRYLREKINQLVTDKGQDFAPIMTEIECFLGLQGFAEQVVIGEANGDPDIRVVHADKRYDIECKSVRFSNMIDKELYGFCSILNTLLKNAEILTAGGSFTSWTIADPKLLRDQTKIRTASEEILEFYRARARGEYAIGPGALLRYHGDRGAGSHQDFHSFINLLGFSSAIHSHRVSLVPTLFVDPEPVQPRWAMAFFGQIDLPALAEACEGAFSDAMGQHRKRSAGGKKVVLINVECVHALETSANGGAGYDIMQVAFKSRADYYARVIAGRIVKRQDWSTCLGLILVLALPPRRLESGGARWERAMTWWSASGGSVIDEFPPFGASWAASGSAASGPTTAR